MPAIVIAAIIASLILIKPLCLIIIGATFNSVGRPYSVATCTLVYVPKSYHIPPVIQLRVTR